MTLPVAEWLLYVDCGGVPVGVGEPGQPHRELAVRAGEALSEVPGGEAEGVDAGKVAGEYHADGDSLGAGVHAEHRVLHGGDRVYSGEPIGN